MSQYVALKITANLANAQLVGNQFGIFALGAPSIILADMEGRLIHETKQPPEGDKLAELLAKTLADHQVLRQKYEIDALLEQVAKHGEEGDVAAAVKLLGPFLRKRKSDQEREGLPQPLTDALAKVDEIVAALEDEGREALEKAQETLQDEDRRLVGAISLMRVQRLYGALPALKAPLTDTIKDVKENSGDSRLLTQARTIDRARAYEEEEKYREAIRTYEQVVSRYPDTLAEKLSRRRIGQLEKKL